MKAVKKALHRTFKAMDAEVIAAEQGAQDPDAQHAGTTASVALQLGKQLYVADVGEQFQNGAQTDLRQQHGDGSSNSSTGNAGCCLR